MDKYCYCSRVTLTLAILLGILVSPLLAQMSSEAKVKDAPAALLKAGENFTFALEFKEPLEFDGQLSGCFNKPPPGAVTKFCCSVGGLKKGQTSASIACSLPFDIDGGVYKSPSTWEYLRYNFSNTKDWEVKTDPFDVSVIPETGGSGVTNTAISATIKLQLTDQQLLRTNAQSLQGVLDTLTTGSNDKTANTQQLRLNLTNAVKQADQLLLDTRTNIEMGMNKPKAGSIMFEDFDRYYKAALTEIGTPGSLASERGSSGYTMVSFQKRPHTTENVTVNDKPTKAAHSFGLTATAVVDLIAENIAAFKKYADTGDDSFHFGLVSEPVGASVSYVRIGEEEQTFTQPTNVENATLPFAKWTFLFKREGCETVAVKPNLYYEDHASVTAHMSCKKAN